jgi:HlyD family secretion protein
MGFKAKTIVGVLAIIGVGAGIAYWTLGRDKSPKTSLIRGKVDRGNVRVSVTATGTLEAVHTVQVGSQISGQVSALHADYNSKVHKGQLLAEIDPRTLQSQLLSEQASSASVDARMKSAQADLINQQANLVQVQANLKVAQVSDENNKLLYERAKQLMAKGLVAQSDLDVARTNAESSSAKVEQAQAAVLQADAQIRAKQASIEQVKSDIAGAKAQLDRAQINLDLTKIYSPVDGVVISRSVDLGQTVAASLSAPVLFLIAEDLTRMHVKANIDEADIGKITPDVRASFTVDAYPNDVFIGHISEVRLEPSTVQNVVTYGVIIDVDNSQLKLKPGMTTNLTLVVDEHTDVLTVPNAALRFNPPGLTSEQVTKMVQELPQLPPPPVAAAPPESATPGQPGQRASAGRGEQGQGGSGRRVRGGSNQGSGGRRGGGGNGGSENGGGDTAGSATTRGFAVGGSNASSSGGQGGGGGFQGGGGGRGNGGRGGTRGGGGGRNQRSVLWTQEPETLAFKPVRVRLGINDGTRTEVSGPDVTEGMEIIIGDLTQSATPTQQRPANNPLVPNLGGGNRGRGGF